MIVFLLMSVMCLGLCFDYSVFKEVFMCLYNLIDGDNFKISINIVDILWIKFFCE